MILLWLACSPEPMPAPVEPFNRLDETLYGPSGETVFTYHNNIVISTPGQESPRLFVLDGQPTDEGYVATRLGVGVVEHPLIGRSDWTLDTECVGGMEQVGMTLTFTTSGHPVCDAFVGP